MIEEKSAKGKKDRKKKKEKSISEDVEKVIFLSTLWFDDKSKTDGEIEMCKGGRFKLKQKHSLITRQGSKLSISLRVPPSVPIQI